jgi:hypothetical protein
MADFSPVLRRLHGQLEDLPPAARSRIVVEISDDLQSLYEHYRTAGADEETALRRAEEKVLASPDALYELIRVHSTGYAGLEGHAAGRLHRGFTAFFLVTGVLPLIVIAALAEIRQIATVGASAALWPILAVGLGITAVTVRKLVQLFGSATRTPARLRGGLITLLFLGALSIVIGLTGFLAALYGVLISLSMAPEATTIPVVLMEELGRHAAALAIGIILGMAAGLAWFLLVRRVAAIERAESAALLRETP